MSLKEGSVNLESEVIDKGCDYGIFIQTSTVPRRIPKDPASNCEIQGTEMPGSPLLSVTIGTGPHTPPFCFIQGQKNCAMSRDNLGPGAIHFYSVICLPLLLLITAWLGFIPNVPAPGQRRRIIRKISPLRLDQ